MSAREPLAAATPRYLVFVFGCVLGLVEGAALVGLVWWLYG